MSSSDWPVVEILLANHSTLLIQRLSDAVTDGKSKMSSEINRHTWVIMEYLNGILSPRNKTWTTFKILPNLHLGNSLYVQCQSLNELPAPTLGLIASMFFAFKYCNLKPTHVLSFSDVHLLEC